MADNGVRTYKIVINGLTESVKAVDALNESLKTLESRINALSNKAVKVSASSGGGSKSSSKSSLSEEEKLMQQINQLEEKRIAHSKQIYQNYLAAKDVLKETENDQKQIAASERLAAKSYSNTMQGMKQELADIKQVMQTIDLGDNDQMNKMIDRANELNEKLKEIEQSYGQFGRNVGNYKSAADGFNKLKITVAGTVHEFDNAKQALKTLQTELRTLQYKKDKGILLTDEEAKRFKELPNVVAQLKSSIQDAGKPMDNLMDTAQSIVAIMQSTKGITAFFGLDNDKIERSIQKLVALQNAMNGLQTLQKQMQSQEGIGKLFDMGNKSIDTFVSKITGAKVGINGLTAATRAGTLGVNLFSMALKGLGVGLVIAGITRLMELFEKMGESLDSDKIKANVLNESLKTLTNSYKERNDLLGASYLKGEISNEEFLTNQYKLQTSYIAEQINLLKERIALTSNQPQSGFERFFSLNPPDVTSSYSGGKIEGEVTIKSYNWIDELNTSFSETVHNIQEVEEEFKKCQDAIKEGKDYFTKWGSGLSDFINSIFTTVDDTERIMRELGKTDLGDFIASFGEVNEMYIKGKISAEQFAEELKKLKARLNDSEVLRSVIANLDKYIPDEEVREAVNNIINEIIRLDDAFNMTSEEQIHYWNQVRIDGMKKGSAKIKAQMDEDERYEIAKHGHTQEQIDLIRQKYNRKRLDEQDKYNSQSNSKAKQHAKDVENAEKELNALRIENMNDGLEKQLAKLEEERRHRIEKAKETGIKVGEITLEINKLYDKKILDAKREWAYNVEQVYTDMWAKIYQINSSNAQMEFEERKREIEEEIQKLRDSASNKLANSVPVYSDQQYKITEEKGKYKIEIEPEIEYTKRLEEEYNKRFEDRKTFFEEIEKLSIDKVNKDYDNQLKKIQESKNNELRTLKNGYAREDHELESHYKKGELTTEKYNEAVERLAQERAVNEANIEIKYSNQVKDIEKQRQEELLKISENTSNSLIDEYQQLINKLATISTSKDIYKGFFLDISAIRTRNNKVIELYRKLSTKIQDEITELENKLKQTDLTEAQRKAIEEALSRLRQLRTNINHTISDIEKDTEEKRKQQLMKIANMLDTLSQLTGYFSDIIGNIYDGMINDQDALIDKYREQADEYEEMLNKQKDITQKYADDINSIEDELKTARGDRRQQLIDNLNAEMAAQRESLAQEKKIEKEKEKAQQKEKKAEEEKKKLQREQAKWEKAMNVTQALMNTAVAITSALTIKPFVPVGMMMAQTASILGLAQVAAILSQPIPTYATGGVIEGPSHKQGGVKVLGGRAEVEGKEFITNKVTTQENVDLMYYINDKKRKLNLDDFIDFYSSGAVRKNIQSVKTRFADGGQIPVLSNSIDINDRMITAMEDYSNRPVVVEVTEILNKADSVRNVQVMAGLTDASSI